MMYADSITKSFLTYGVSPASKPGDAWQDPTYLGFYVSILPPYPHHDYNFNDLPHGLFRANPFDEYSTYTYLMNRGETYRADLIRKFEIGFSSLIKNYPWYFQKISGLADAWKIDPKNNWRGKDKKITIDTLESIDLRVSYLLDCYRKATFDFAWHRWAVPDHMRMFDLKVVVCEIRNMKQTPVSRQDGIINPGFSYPLTELPTLAEMNDEQGKTLGLYDTGLPWSAGTFYEFIFKHCELDVFSEAPPHLDNVTAYASAEPAMNKIVIKTPIISDQNTYGLLGAVIRNTEDFLFYDTNNFEFTSPEPPLVNDVVAQTNGFTNYATGFASRIDVQEKFNSDRNSDNVTPPLDKTLRKVSATSGVDADGNPRTNDQGISVDRDKSVTNNTIGVEADPTRDTKTWESQWNNQHRVQGGKAESVPPSPSATGTSPGSKGQRRPSNLEKGAKAAFTDLIKTQVNRVLLGNVYGLSPLTIRGQVQGFLNDPIGAVTSLLQKFSSPQIGKDISKKVTLSGPEIKLVSDVIGKGEMLSSGANTEGTPGKSTLTSPNVNTTPGGKVILEEPFVNRDPDSNVNLQGADVNRTPGGNVNLQGADVNRTPDKNVRLTGAEIKPGNPGKTNLASANINNQGEKTVRLVAPPVSQSNPGKTNLTSFASLAASPSSVEFKGPIYPRPTRQRTRLKAPLLQNTSDLPKVELVAPEISRVKLGSVKFISAEITRDFLSKVRFVSPLIKPVELGKASFI
jgi:uncharacterized protein YjbI with pentapeptide repeats